MAPKKQQRARKKNGKSKMVVRGEPRASAEHGILRLVMDPCGAPLARGFATTSEGIVQRFNRFITPVATTETAFAYVWNPSNTQVGGGAITQKLAVGTGAPTNFQTDSPGVTFIQANSDYVATLAACVEVLYTGTLVNRKGYIGLCQANNRVLADLAAGTTDLPTLLSYCQQVAPVPSHTVELKWSPSIRNFTAQNAHAEIGANADDNALMLVAVGVNPTDFVVKFTTVYEYQPKFALGLPATRPTRSVPVGVAERVVTTLDRMGTWWHNLGDAAGAAYRLGAAAYYGAGQVARTAGAYARVAAPLLALAG